MRLMICLACRVIARVLVPYSLFSRGGSQMFLFDNWTIYFILLSILAWNYRSLLLFLNELKIQLRQNQQKIYDA